jgi:WD repeat and SOF domain-containing protein 1
MDLDISPTGREFVTASYDKTIRIFDATEGRSREVYHGKRMHLLYSVLWSMDNEYIYSGSDDMNIRIWKTNASKPLGVILKRESIAMNYKDALKSKFGHVREIRKISRFRHLPKYILNSKLKKVA